jgi:hypothetical protein
MTRATPPQALPNEYFDRPSPARMWNYLQGGNDNYALDRVAGDAMAGAFPDIFELAQQTRRFLARAVRHLAAEHQVGQFLDIGCGLPAPSHLDNLHEIAQSIRPAARVVYVDNDKVVLAHARALMTSSSDQGRCAYIDADVCEPDRILAEAADTLDFTVPTAVCLLGILGHVPDFAEACSIVDRLLAVFPSGSFLVLADGFDDRGPLNQGVADRNETGIDPYTLRTMDQFHRYLRGLEILEPGIGSIALWRPDPIEVGSARAVLQYGGVARKP